MWAWGFGYLMPQLSKIRKTLHYQTDMMDIGPVQNILEIFVGSMAYHDPPPSPEKKKRMPGRCSIKIVVLLWLIDCILHIQHQDEQP